MTSGSSGPGPWLWNRSMGPFPSLGESCLGVFHIRTDLSGTRAIPEHVLLEQERSVPFRAVYIL